MATSGRLQQQYRTQPDLIRSLPVGEAVIIQSGRWAHVAMAPPKYQLEPPRSTDDLST
jgi:hypothetical protein